VFSLFGSKNIAAFFAAKINLFALVLVFHSLLPGNEFVANRIFFQGITYRHIPKWFLLPGFRNWWFLASSCYQPVGKIDQDGNDDYP
jgi:hypothetical protein